MRFSCLFAVFFAPVVLVHGQYIYDLSTPFSACVAAIVHGSLSTPTDPSYVVLKQEFSKYYDSWPTAIMQSVPLIGSTSTSRADESLVFAEASQDQMIIGESVISDTLRCASRFELPVTARSGGHNNAGGSVQDGALTIDVRGLNKVTLAMYESAAELPAHYSKGTVTIGSGATAGQSAFLTYSRTTRLSLNVSSGVPVGQKPSVGVAGLTLGGGFGFSSRYAGLLCDRIVSLRAVVPDTGEIIAATKDNEYSDLVWAACGGGGGNYAVVTEFEFQTMPICTQQGAADKVCTAVVLEHYVEYSVELVAYFQEWSLRIDPRITANFEVYNSTHGMIVGIWMGSLPQFKEALVFSGLTKDTVITIDDVFSSASPSDFAEAMVKLSGWTPGEQESSVLLDSFLNERTFFKYTSFFLMQALPDWLFKEFIAKATLFNDDNSSLVFELQSLGGDPKGSGIPGAEMYTNNFSSIDPTSTAFPHRNARHCLMFKATAVTEASSFRLFTLLQQITQIVQHAVLEPSPYYNHMVTSFPGVEPYFVNGVESLWDQGFMPASEPKNPWYYFERLAKIRTKYNRNDTLSNVRACCGPDDSPPKPVPVNVAAITLGVLFGALLAANIVLLAPNWVKAARSDSARPDNQGMNVQAGQTSATAV